jgi:hypothetical protein
MLSQSTIPRYPVISETYSQIKPYISITIIMYCLLVKEYRILGVFQLSYVTR